MNPADEVLEIKIRLPCYKGWDGCAEDMANRIQKYIGKKWKRVYFQWRIRKPLKSEL